MKVNLKYRNLQINNKLKQYDTEPYYDEIKQLYQTGKITRITTAINYITKIKYKKNGEIDRRTTRKLTNIIAKEILKKQPVYKAPTKKNENILIVDDYKINNLGYTYYTHEIELKKMKAKFPNSLYYQKIEYYDDDGNIINGFRTNDENDDDFGEPISEDFKNRKFEFLGAFTKQKKQQLEFLVQSKVNYIWLSALLVDFFYPNGYTKIITRAYSLIDEKDLPKFASQTYKDNDNGICVYDAFVKYFTKKSEKNKNAKAVLNKLLSKEGEKYKKSYNNETLPEIASFCNSSVMIRDLIRGSEHDKFIKTDYARFRVELLNTKFNHLDLLITDGEEIEINDYKEMEKIKKNLPFYVEKCGKVIGNDNTYVMKKSEFDNVFDNWKHKKTYNESYILEDSIEYDFICNYHYKLHSFFKTDWEINNDKYKELDLKKAYFNYSDKKFNPHYVGLPSGSFINVKCSNDFTMETFDRLLSSNLIGFFEVKILDINEYKDHFDVLGFKKENKYILTTPTIQLLRKYINFQFLNCSYSTNIDIPFSEEFKDKSDGIKHYCKAFGLMIRESSDIQITIKPLVCDKKYYSIVSDEKYKMFQTDDTIKISHNDYQKSSRTHLGYFIHSYTRTLIIEKLLSIDINKVFGIKLDSIVLKKNYADTLKYDNFVWGLKRATGLDKMLQSYDSTDLDIGIESDEVFDKYDYNGHYCDYINSHSRKFKMNLPFTQNKEYITNRIVCIGGKGGSGKSYSLFNSGNFDRNRICYTSKCWNLIQGQMTKYNGINGYSIPNLTGYCDGKKTEKIYNSMMRFIVIDELTLIDEKSINTIIKEYPNCFIFIVGDVDKDGYFYQCNLQNKVYKPKNNHQYIKYSKSYRFNTELDEKLNKLREFMKCNKNILKLNKFVKNEFSNCIIKKENVEYNNNDIGISALNDYNNGNNMTNYFVDKGTKPKYFIKKTDKKRNHLCGREILEKPSHKNFEMKLFKTIHSFQGLDLDDDNKIIISITKNFDYNLFYTAFSRARRLDQIKLLI